MRQCKLLHAGRLQFHAAPGRAVVATAPLERAEMYAQRLHDEVVSYSGTLLGTSIEPA